MNTTQTAQRLLPIARALVLRAGARHSQADNTDIQAMHDLACKLGAKCKTISDGTHTQFSAEAMKAELYDALVLRHPGHPNQKTHGNRFGTGQAKESLRRLKDDKGAREKYKESARGRGQGSSTKADKESHKAEKVKEIDNRIDELINKQNRLMDKMKQFTAADVRTHGRVLGGQRAAGSNSKNVLNQMLEIDNEIRNLSEQRQGLN